MCVRAITSGAFVTLSPSALRATRPSRKAPSVLWKAAKSAGVRSQWVSDLSRLIELAGLRLVTARPSPQPLARHDGRRHAVERHVGPPGFEALRNALRRVAPVQSHVCPRSEGTKRGCEDRARAGYIGAVPHLRAGHSARWLRVSLSSAQSIMSLLLPQFDGTSSHFLRADREG